MKTIRGKKFTPKNQIWSGVTWDGTEEHAKQIWAWLKLDPEKFKFHPDLLFTIPHRELLQYVHEYSNSDWFEAKGFQPVLKGYTILQTKAGQMIVCSPAYFEKTFQGL